MSRQVCARRPFVMQCSLTPEGVAFRTVGEARQVFNDDTEAR